jgi:hypothetical protein
VHLTVFAIGMPKFRSENVVPGEVRRGHNHGIGYAALPAQFPCRDSLAEVGAPGLDIRAVELGAGRSLAPALSLVAEIGKSAKRQEAAVGLDVHAKAETRQAKAEQLRLASGYD